MSFSKFKVIENQVKQVSGYMVTDELPIPLWSKRDGVHTSPNAFTYREGTPAQVTLKDTWETGYDLTSWFKASVAVPPEMDGKKVYLEIDFGGEALVRINGKIVGAVSSAMNSGWVHRDRLLLGSPARCGTVYDIEVEATVNSGGFCDNAMAGEKTVRYTLKTACLVAVDELCEQYWFLLKNTAEGARAVKDEVTQSRLMRAVDDSVHALDFDMGKDIFLASLPAAYALLKQRLLDMPKNSGGEVVMTGHSHLDVAWLWTVKEIVRKTARTFSNNLALMDQYPDFCFCQSQAVLYDFMKQYYPDIFEQVKEKVKSGQWEITGTAWVEADTNIASGESLIRQLLYGRRFFLKEFGVCSEVYWLPDCFGFTWALPQIIKKSGLKYFLTSKLNSNDTSPFPHSKFIWRAHSGDEVLAYLTPRGYGGDYTAADVEHSFHGDRQADVADTAFCMFGYGDGGGGCTYAMVENGRALSQISGLTPSREGTVASFFNILEEKKNELPVWDGELYYENHRGTYTSQAFVKKYNRYGEFLFRNAELISVFAALFAGLPAPADALEEGWKLLLINQFHDILPGTSIHEVYDVCREEYARMTGIGIGIKAKAFEALGEVLGVPEDAVAVWNMNTWEVTAPVRVQIPAIGGSVRDAAGKEMLSIFYEKDGACFAEFIAEGVPSAGYKAFFVSPEPSSAMPVFASAERLENECLRVLFDRDGRIVSLVDKRFDREILKGTGNQLTVFQDKPIHESAWNLEADLDRKCWELKAQSVEVVESSPLRGALKMTYRFHDSVITQHVVLYAGGDTLLFDTGADWQETEKTLKAAFTADIRALEASYEIAHGAITRPTHRNTPFDAAKFEVAAHKWADLSQTDYGVSLMSDCKYGYDIYGNRMRLTLLRSPNCPDTTADKGGHTFVYALYPHLNRWQDGGTVGRAFELNNPLEAVFCGVTQSGTPFAARSLLEVSAKNVILDALKPAEDGTGFILRVYEAEGRRTRVKINLPLKAKTVSECDMMEENMVPVSADTDALEFTITPFEVKTFHLKV